MQSTQFSVLFFWSQFYVNLTNAIYTLREMKYWTNRPTIPHIPCSDIFYTFFFQKTLTIHKIQCKRQTACRTSATNCLVVSYYDFHCILCWSLCSVLGSLQSYIWMRKQTLVFFSFSFLKYILFFIGHFHNKFE